MPKARYKKTQKPGARYVTQFNSLKQEIKDVYDPADTRWLCKVPGSQQLQMWVDEVIETLGGGDRVTPQQRALVSSIAKTYLILEVVDGYLFRQPDVEAAIVNSAKHSLRPIVVQRQQLADSLARQLVILGLDPSPLREETFLGYINEKVADKQEALPAPTSDAEEDSATDAAADDIPGDDASPGDDDEMGRGAWPTPPPTILSPGTGFLYVDFRDGDDEETLAAPDAADLEGSSPTAEIAPAAQPASVKIR